MTAPELRAATVTDLPALLDLYQHLHPGEALPDPTAAHRIFTRLQTYPGSAIFLTVFAYNLIGEAMRDVIDPRAAK